MAQLDRLHSGSDGDDDLYELVQYTRTQGESQVSEKPANLRALGIKPYSTRTESAFLENLNHALDNALLGGSRCVVHKEVPISQVFADDAPGRDLFYPQLGVKLCSMAGGGVQKIYMVFLREPSRRDRSGSDLFHLWDGFEIKMNFDRNVSCFIFVNALMHDDFFD